MATGILTLDADMSLDRIWTELVYTEARLLADPYAKSHAPAFEALLAHIEEVRTAQYTVWRATIVAQAGVDVVDNHLDDRVAAVDNDALYAVKQDRKDPRYQRYFREPRSRIVGRALGSEIDVVRGWPESLDGEPEAALKAHAEPLRGLITDGARVLEARRKAEGERADFRVRERIGLVDQANATRRAVLGDLVTYAAENGKPGDWPTRFFR